LRKLTLAGGDFRGDFSTVAWVCNTLFVVTGSMVEQKVDTVLFQELSWKVLFSLRRLGSRTGDTSCCELESYQSNFVPVERWSRCRPCVVLSKWDAFVSWLKSYAESNLWRWMIHMSNWIV
jgi:hypothetical protein